MKRWLSLLILVGCAFAQNTSTIGVLPDNGATLPLTCVIGQIYFKTAAPIGLNQCNPANTWTAFSTSSGTGTVTNTGGSLPNNFVVIGNTSPDIKADTKLSTDGAGAMTTTTGGTALTHTQGTITTSNPTFSHTATWNAGGVAFTNWLSNITCTAAATASIALGLGTSGTQWQFKYNGTNCANPQLIMPAGTALNPALTAGSSTGVFFLPASGVAFTQGGTEIGEIDGTNFFSKVPYCTFAGNTCLTEAAGIVSTTGSDNPVLKPTNNVAILTSDFTDSNASGLQVITGLAITFPAVAKNYAFHCSLTYSEATPIASDQFGVASLTTAPTNLHAQAHVITTEGAAAAQTTGDSGNITTTTPTSIVTFTPVGTGVKPVEIDGSIEVAGGGASTLQFYVTNGTAADVIVIKRDSYCWAF